MKVTPISGFPEWLPAQRRAEQRLIDTLRQQFELFGFLPIETRAIEPLDVLLHKGNDKERVYELLNAQVNQRKIELGDQNISFFNFFSVNTRTSWLTK